MAKFSWKRLSIEKIRKFLMPFCLLFVKLFHQKPKFVKEVSFVVSSRTNLKVLNEAPVITIENTQ